MQAVTAEGGWALRRPAQVEGGRSSRREASLSTKQVRPLGERRKTHRLLADWNHRLGNGLGIIANARSQTSAEKNNFHLPGRSLYLACNTDWLEALIKGKP